MLQSNFESCVLFYGWDRTGTQEHTQFSSISVSFKKDLTSIWWIPIPDLMHVFLLTTVSISLQSSQVDLEITFEEQMKKLLTLSIWQQLKLVPEKSHILFIVTYLSFSLL